jgi:hypothetical protein
MRNAFKRHSEHLIVGFDQFLLKQQVDDASAAFFSSSRMAIPAESLPASTELPSENGRPQFPRLVRSFPPQRRSSRFAEFENGTKNWG